MVTAGRIDMEKVAEILAYWDYEHDLPMPLGKLRQVFREYFGVDCPL
jgi:predicted solute-binding protein